MVLHSKLCQPVRNVVSPDIHCIDQRPITLCGSPEGQVCLGQMCRHPPNPLPIITIQSRVQQAVDSS